MKRCKLVSQVLPHSEHVVVRWGIAKYTRRSVLNWLGQLQTKPWALIIEITRSRAWTCTHPNNQFAQVQTSFPFALLFKNICKLARQSNVMVKIFWQHWSLAVKFPKSRFLGLSLTNNRVLQHVLVYTNVPTSSLPWWQGVVESIIKFGCTKELGITIKFKIWI